MITRILLVTAMVSLFAGMLGFAPVQQASAATIQRRVATHPTKSAMPDLCKSQSSGVEVIWPSYPGGLINYHYFTCSGTYNVGIPDATINVVSWSGYVYIDEGQGPFWEGYCDGDSLWANDLITITLSTVREPFCS